MKLVIDMNLSPEWVDALKSAGHEAVHWSHIGNVRASDSELMAWARAHESVVLTQDLDFTTLLALSRGTGPSIVQLRIQDTMSESMPQLVAKVLLDHAEPLAAGAIVSVDELHARVRILPIQ